MTPLHEAAYRFAAYLTELERRLRRSARSSPSEATQRELAEKLSALNTTFERGLAANPPDELDRLKRDIREILGPFLWRSELWNRAYHKPHGYAGDFGLLEALDALDSEGADALKPPLSASLDHAFAELDFACALRERRALLSGLLFRERAKKGASLSILDIAPHGARHLGDYLGQLADPNDERLTIIDSDTAALAFLERDVFSRFDLRPRMISEPFHRVRSTLLNERYDVILVSNALDDLDDDSAREDLAALSDCLANDGVLIAANLDPGDHARTLREWLLDWPCYLRDPGALSRLLPDGAEASRSPDGLLSVATFRRAS